MPRNSFVQMSKLHNVRGRIYYISSDKKQEKHFASDSDLGLEDIYSEVFSLEHDEVSHLAKDITRIFNVSFDTFADAPEDEKEFLHTFSFICMLSFDVFVKKMMIEKIIDELPKNDPREKEKAEKKEKKQKRTE